jgi:hypothetical protein
MPYGNGANDWWWQRLLQPLGSRSSFTRARFSPLERICLLLLSTKAILSRFDAIYSVDKPRAGNRLSEEQSRDIEGAAQGDGSQNRSTVYREGIIGKYENSYISYWT